MLGLVAILSIPVILILFYTRGPIPLLRLIPYETELSRVAFPQWLSNDEICYLEIIFHGDKTIFEQGKSMFFRRQTITDMYIYREKIEQPETKKLIKHIARKDIPPSQLLGGSLDADWGFRVYDNGKKLFLYYHYPSKMPSNFRYVTMDIKGDNVKERIPKIFPFDISQDGRKLYGIFIENESSSAVKTSLTHLSIKRSSKEKRFIAECVTQGSAVKKLMEINDEKLQQTSRSIIYDLKLVAKDKILLAYTGDINKADRFQYVYLFGIESGKTEFVCDPSKAYFDDNMPYCENYMFDPNQGSALTKDGKFLILGNGGIYAQRGNNWVKLKPFFFAEYPAISPDGTKIAFFNILTKKGELNSTWFAGRELKVVNLKDLIEGTEVNR